MNLVVWLLFSCCWITWVDAWTSFTRRRSSRLLSGDTSRTSHKLTSLESIVELPTLPKLIVFDLDNTLWTPELYQLNTCPKAHQDIRLFDDARTILQFLAQHQHNNITPLAVASRTSKGDWAHALLDEFGIGDQSLRSLFQYVEIYTGSKKRHLAQLRNAAQCAYSDMLFVDDDARLNLGEVSQLGVLCVHTPHGITEALFIQALHKYSELKTGHDHNHWMGYVLTASSLGLVEPSSTHRRPCQGTVKFYSSQKRFGFVKDDATGEEFFVHESKIPLGRSLMAGESVVFEATTDSKGRPSAVILETKSSTTTRAMMPTMPCFTMSQPFAALLLNGVKSVESRNNAMFADVAPGTQVLLHCGQRDWPDQESYQTILAEMGKDASWIAQKSRLPEGFSKGSIVGVITVGKTWRASEAERQGRDLKYRVLAPYQGIGEYCTEIVEAQWLPNPLKSRGSPGVYNTEIPHDYLPRATTLRVP